jgi:hypothetical protein
MDTSHDKVILTTDERRILAALEQAASHRALHRRLLLTAAACTSHLQSSRMRHAATVLLFVAGATLMVATFTRWPAVALIGVAMQAGAVRWALTLLAPHITTWVSDRARRSMSDHPTNPPR